MMMMMMVQLTLSRFSLPHFSCVYACLSVCLSFYYWYGHLSVTRIGSDFVLQIFLFSAMNFNSLFDWQTAVHTTGNTRNLTTNFFSLLLARYSQNCPLEMTMTQCKIAIHWVWLDVCSQFGDSMCCFFFFCCCCFWMCFSSLRCSIAFLCIYLWVKYL